MSKQLGPIFITAKNSQILSVIRNAISSLPLIDGVLTDSKDRIRFITSTDNLIEETNVDQETAIKQFIIKDTLPTERDLPSLGSIQTFYDTLESERQRLYPLYKEINFLTGNILLCTEITSSTQTILANNYQLLRALPTGVVFYSGIQSSGKGRGSNSWTSPPGCLQFSFILRHNINHFNGPSSAIFIQYIAAMAVKRTICSSLSGYENLPIKLKWPNDIYAYSLNDNNDLVKIGGILVTSTIENNQYVMVIGIGLNLTNTIPTTCLSDIIQSYNIKFSSNLITPEPTQLLASILVNFDILYAQFQKGGFNSLLPEYLESWLHTNQILNISNDISSTIISSRSSSLPIRVKITGVTTDFGLLKGVKVDENGRELTGPNSHVELQPDGNSLDLMKGMIMRKGMK